MSSNDNICNIVLYKLFPNSDRVINNEIRQLEKDLDKLYNELREEQSIANELKTTIGKLNNRKIAIDANGMTREDLIKSTQNKLMIVLRKIKGLQNQISLFEGSKYTMENSQMATDMEKRISVLSQRMQRVRTINTDNLNNDIDEIADMNDHVEKINTTINDTMVSAWTVDMDSDEAMLKEFLETNDEEDDDEDIIVNNNMPVAPTSLPKLSRPKEDHKKPIRELF